MLRFRSQTIGRRTPDLRARPLFRESQPNRQVRRHATGAAIDEEDA
jgi:hypothetical protein